MRFLRLLIVIVRLPIDLVLFSVDVLRMTLWCTGGLFWRLIGGPPPPYGPCVQGEYDEVDGEEIRSCPPSGKYACRWYVATLCPGSDAAATGDGKLHPICGIEGIFRFRFLRFAGIWLVLLAVWGGLATGGGAFVWTSYGDRIAAFLEERRRETPLPDTDTVTTEDSRSEARRLVVKSLALQEQGDFAGARTYFEEAVALDPSNLEACLGLARVSVALDLPDDAARAFARAEALDKTLLEPVFQQAQLALRRGRQEVALRFAQRASELAPEDYDVQVALSESWRRNGQPDEAVRAAERAVEIDPGRAEGRVELASAHLMGGDLDLAETQYRACLDIDPEILDARIGVGRIMRSRGAVKAALAHFQSVCDEFPDHTDAAVELAELTLVNGFAERATVLFERIVDDEPALYGVRARYAELLIQVGRQDDAYRELTEVLEGEPGNVLAHLVLADLFLSRNFSTLALDHVRRALAHQPGDMRAYRLQVRALLAQDDFAAAQMLLEMLVQKRPREMQLHLMLARCHIGQDQPEEAAEILSEAETRFPASGLPSAYLGQVEAGRGNHAEAIATYRRGLKRDPDNVVALNNLSLLLMEDEGASEEARECARRAYELAPDNPRIVDTYGWASLQAGEPDVAVLMSSFAAKQLPRNSTIRYHLGAALIDAGDPEAGCEQLRLSLKLSPEGKDAENARLLLSGEPAQSPPSDTPAP